MISVLIVDDEPPARQRIRSLLDIEQDFTVVGECATAAEARDLLDEVDAVFLDVQMPGGDGFSALGHGEPPPLVVFVSAHAEHAVRAFGVRAVDYLLKPFSRERFRETLDRIREARPGRPTLDRLPVEYGGGIRLVDLADIDYLRAEGNYVRVHTGATSYLIRRTLAGLEIRLASKGFLRVHRSLIVRLAAIRQIEVLGHGELALELASGTTLISGRAFREQVRAALGL